MNPFHKKIAIQILVSLGIIAVLVTGILFLGFNVSQFSEKITSAKQELATRSVSLQSLATLKSDFESKGQAHLSVLRNFVPQKDTLIELSSGFETIAAEKGLEYGFTFVGETPAGAQNFGSVRFNLSLGGSINELLNFLRDLQNFRYLLNIESVSLERRALDMRMNLTGSVFFKQ